MPQPDDFDAEQPVIEAILQGDRYAFDELTQRQGAWVRGVIFGVLGDAGRVDDVLQQVWTAFWQQASQIRDPARWKTWLYRLARNAAVDAGRRSTRERRTEAAVTEAAAESVSGATPRDEAIKAEQYAAIHRAVEALPALYREPFVLRHVQNWSYRQIAEVMDLPVDTVETRLVRARRLLREALTDKV